MRAQGIDVSKWDISFNPDAAIKPLDFVIQRVGYGAQSGVVCKDPALDPMYPGVLKVPIRGAYWYFSTHSTWQAQANFFLELVGDKDYHFYVADFEDAYNVLSDQAMQDCFRWMEHVKLMSGLPVLIYTNPSLYNQYAWKYCAGWPLWIAQYYTNNPSPDKDPAMPSKRKSWDIWQWASEINYVGHGKEYGVGGNSVDLNVYNGIVEEMRAWLGLGATAVLPIITLGERVEKLEAEARAHGWMV